MTPLGDAIRTALERWDFSRSDLAQAVADVERALLTASTDALAGLMENRVRYSVAKADASECAGLAIMCKRVGRLASPLAKRNRAEYHRQYMARRRAAQKGA